MDSVRILAMAGCLRKESLNKKLLAVAVADLRAKGAEVDVLDLHDIDMPLYDQDIEDTAGLPPGALAFKRRIGLANGLLFASPEYNASIPGPFKNALDWASRGTDDPLRGKIAALMSASPGLFGGIRMNPHLRQVMRALGVYVIHEQVTLGHATEAFDEAGALRSTHVINQVDTLARCLIDEIRLRHLGIERLRLTIFPEHAGVEQKR